MTTEALRTLVIRKIRKMKQRVMKPFSSAIAMLRSKVESSDIFKIGGMFTVTCYDKNGVLKWAERNHNIWVQRGISYVLSGVFKAGTLDDPLYVGLTRDESGSPATGWSMGNAGGATWTEFTQYNDNREEWAEGAISAGGRVTNSANKAVFTISGAGGTIGGAFLVNTPTVKNGTNGILLCADDFGTARVVAAGDEVQVTYSVGADDV